MEILVTRKHKVCARVGLSSHKQTTPSSPAGLALEGKTKKTTQKSTAGVVSLWHSKKLSACGTQCPNEFFKLHT